MKKCLITYASGLLGNLLDNIPDNEPFELTIQADNITKKQLKNFFDNHTFNELFVESVCYDFIHRDIIANSIFGSKMSVDCTIPIYAKDKKDGE